VEWELLEIVLLTSERYLTSVENRLRRLEALFGELLPDVDIEAALASHKKSSSVTAVKTQDIAVGVAESQTNLQYEALPLVAAGFEWKESSTDIDELADGKRTVISAPDLRIHVSK